LREQVSHVSDGNAEPTGESHDQSLGVLSTATGALGAALAAFFAALCCVGPSTVALFGAGGALAAASLKPYRPYFLIGSLALILYGFWRTYGRPKFRPGAACPLRVGRVARSALWLSALVWLAAAFLFGLQ
jgi:hypothetical protein